MIRKICGLAAIAGIAAAASVATVPNAVAAESQYLRFSQWLPPGHWSQRDLMWVWFKEICESRMALIAAASFIEFRQRWR